MRLKPCRAFLTIGLSSVGEEKPAKPWIHLTAAIVGSAADLGPVEARWAR